MRLKTNIATSENGFIFNPATGDSFTSNSIAAEILTYMKAGELTEDIKQLAIRHVAYGVKITHYKFVGEALLWTLEQGLGKDWNEEVESAWTACYTTLSETMIKAAYH